MMGNMKHCLGVGLTFLFLSNFCSGQDAPKAGASLETKLDLSPKSGYGDGDTVQVDAPSELEASGGATGYAVHGGGGNNLVSPTQCQCIPVEQCPLYNGGGGGGGGGSYGGGQQGGNLPISPPAPGGGNYGGGQQGGNLPISPGEGRDSYGGGQQGGNGNIPVSPPGGSYGGGQGQQGGNSGGGGSYGPEGPQGGIIPIPGPEGQHGGNIPVIGGGGAGGNYGGGDAGHDSGHNTDGAGLLDLRIVNRPPRPGGVQCLDGHVFCCDLGGPSNPSYPQPGPGGNIGGGGYATCGTRNFIDVPGKPQQYGDAKFGAYPWMAVILGKGNNYVGAGALISPNYVLTAAHKIKSWNPGSAMKVRFGEWNAKEDDEPYKNVEVPIESVLIHPGFNPKNLQNDIALVRLASPLDLSAYPHVKSVCLPQPSYPYTGQRCWVAGFGKDAFGGGHHSYIMKEVDLPILDSNDCEQRLRSTRLGKYFELNRHSFLCAGGEEGKDACTGDGGSPLVCQTGQGGGFEVAGLVAWGIGCADYGIPGVYVNVPIYVDWINQEIYRSDQQPGNNY